VKTSPARLIHNKVYFFLWRTSIRLFPHFVPLQLYQYCCFHFPFQVLLYFVVIMTLPVSWCIFSSDTSFYTYFNTWVDSFNASSATNIIKLFNLLLMKLRLTSTNLIFTHNTLSTSFHTFYVVFVLCYLITFISSNNVVFLFLLWRCSWQLPT
jgi:hypothetical protein